ncbi:uncharacterized protein LOC144125308 [Amblyomma americanum]
MREKDRLLASLLERLALPASSGAPGVAAATTTYQVMPDLSKNISDFDGSGDAASAKEWLGNLQTTATLHRWPEPFMLETAKWHLVGPAKDWLRSRKEVSTSWENFDYHFRRTFCGQTRAAERWRKMQERVQQRNESTTAYFHSKVRLCREANLDFCDTREQVLTGLRSRQLCTMLLGRTHEDDDDLLHDIMEFERIDREREQRFGGTREKRQFTAATERVAETPPARKTTYDRFGKDRTPPLTNERGQFKCYSCGRFGHISRDCPEERHEMKCLRCGKSGHTQRHCSMSQSNETNTVTDTERKIAPGALLKQAMLNGTTTLVGMIDNGSSGCLLRASAAARCGARLTKDATALYGFGSQGTPSARAIGKCYTDLEINGVKGENVPFLVVPDDTLTVDLLVGRTREGLLHPIPPGKRPFEVIHMDHMGPFVPSKKRNQYLLVFIDNLTRFVRLIATRDTSAKHVLRALEEFVLERGLPRTVISDRGSCFTSRAFAEFCTARCIRHVLNSTRHPQANGLVERVNRTVLPVIATSMSDPKQRDWDEKLSKAERDINNAVNKTSGKTPFEMLYGYQPEFHSTALRRIVGSDEAQWENPEELRTRVRQRIIAEQEKSKAEYDRRHFPARLYDVGDIVFMTKAPEQTGKPTKAQPHVSQLKGWTSTHPQDRLEDDESSTEEEDTAREVESVPQPLRRSERKRAVPS